MATRFPIPIEQSPNDKRSYRLITLTNGLEAMLIHDASTDKAAVSMSVGVGHLSDPVSSHIQKLYRVLILSPSYKDELPGLAHFCEHMLFLGTEKVRNKFLSLSPEAIQLIYLTLNSILSNQNIRPFSLRTLVVVMRIHQRMRRIIILMSILLLYL